MTQSQGLSERTAELREAFDRSFALPAPDTAETRQMFLLLGAGAERYAVAIDALQGIENRRKIVPLPRSAPGLLGLAGFRGQLAPVFSLASLAGSPAGPDPPTWLAFAKGPVPMAFAFDRLEGSWQVPSRDICREGPGESAADAVRQSVRIGSGLVRVMDVPGLIRAAGQSLGRSP